ncbi:hypothetical protein [Streptomyces sp. NPDC091278]|uniref:hypothetical protein n=1 Tax=Streptomyces sp. NPDC091278 TaxID=3155301 RepID=UPI003450D547
MSENTEPEPEAGRTKAAAAYAQRLALALTLVREVVWCYGKGEALPTVNAIARHLGIEADDVRRALARLDLNGEIFCPLDRHRAPVYRLRPTEQHPADTGFDRAVRASIKDGSYRPGMALPTTVLAVRHGLTAEAVPRALRGVIRDRLVVAAVGPAGPGFYVQPVPGTPAKPPDTP